MWYTVCPEEEELPLDLSGQNVSQPSDGYVQPYAHAPLRDKQILSRIYETTISRAVKKLQAELLNTPQSCQELRLPQDIHSGLSGV